MSFDLPYFIKYTAHFFEENYDEILPAHLTLKAPENGFKIGKVMAQKWSQN